MNILIITADVLQLINRTIIYEHTFIFNDKVLKDLTILDLETYFC